MVVIGGGAAGLEAAAENAKRGHQVILMEKSGSLGGQLFYADHVSFKKEMKLFREYLGAPGPGGRRGHSDAHRSHTRVGGRDGA